jgi:hypothetical protein
MRAPRRSGSAAMGLSGTTAKYRWARRALLPMASMGSPPSRAIKPTMVLRHAMVHAPAQSPRAVEAGSPPAKKSKASPSSRS